MAFSRSPHQFLLMLTFPVAMVQWSKLVDLTRHLPYWNVQAFPPMSLSSVTDPALDPLLGILALLFPCFVQPLKVPPSLLISYESNTLGGTGELFYRWSLNLSGAFELWLTWSVPSRNPVEWPCAPLPTPHPVRGCDVNRPCSWAVHQHHLHKKFLPGSLFLFAVNKYLWAMHWYCAESVSLQLFPTHLNQWTCNNYSWPWTTQVWIA